MNAAVVFGFSSEALVLAVAVGIGVAVAVANRRRRRKERKNEDFYALALRDGLRPTVVPCSLTPDDLASRFAVTPRGDRRYGLEYGLTGPLEVTLAGARYTLECAMFRWWWEVPRRRGESQHVDRRQEAVVVVRLPVHVPSRLLVRPESVLGRLGLRQDDQQLESSEFNRRFRVEARNRTLAVHLLDARLQAMLARDFDGRSLEIADDLLLVAGPPIAGDPALAGFIGDLAGLRSDMQRFLETVPGAFWRAVGLSRLQA